MEEFEVTTYMLENPFYFPGMTPTEHGKIVDALAYRDDTILDDVLSGKVKLKERKDRDRKYIFNMLGIK